MIWNDDTVGQRIQRLRERRGLTQEGLGSLCDLTGRAINRIEKGMISVETYPEYLERIAKALRVSEEVLLSIELTSERETWGEILNMRKEGILASNAEAQGLRELATAAIKKRSSVRNPLSRPALEALLEVLRG